MRKRAVTVREKAGAWVMQNPSDPDASYDGQKGPGYQVQVSETCHEDNDVQLITAALPQTAAAPDAYAIPEMVSCSWLESSPRPS